MQKSRFSHVTAHIYLPFLVHCLSEYQSAIDKASNQPLKPHYPTPIVLTFFPHFLKSIFNTKHNEKVKIKSCYCFGLINYSWAMFGQQHLKAIKIVLLNSICPIHVSPNPQHMQREKLCTIYADFAVQHIIPPPLTPLIISFISIPRNSILVGIIDLKYVKEHKSYRKAMNRNWRNQTASPALKTKKTY